MKTKIVECSLGTKTSEPMARKVDELLPTLPKELRCILTKSTVKTDLAEGESRTDISVITTNTPDRDSEIVLPEGMELDDYILNPVVLYGHEQNNLVGKCLWIKKIENGLIAKSHYTVKPDWFEGAWLSDFVWAMVEADVLRGKSVGFLPLEARELTPEEEELYPSVHRIITRSHLIEYSCVAVPSNPKALVEAINKGLTTLDKWGYTTVGSVKPKIVKAKHVKHYHAPKLNLDAKDIADEVVKKILERWEV